VSSAYWTIGKSEVGWGIGIVSKFIDAALLINTCKSSAANTNKRGDSGSPYRTPLLHLKNFPGVPFKRIADDPDERITCIHCSHLLGKPKCAMT
jgi:hypothetical protein